MANGSLNKDADGLWTNGMKGQLPLGLGTTATNQPIVNRTIFTNRKISTAAPYTASDSNTLKK